MFVVKCVSCEKYADKIPPDVAQNGAIEEWLQKNGWGKHEDVGYVCPQCLYEMCLPYGFGWDEV